MGLGQVVCKGTVGQEAASLQHACIKLRSFRHLGAARFNMLRPTSRADARKKGFKKGIDADDARRKREDNIVELRKTKRDENLQKKRMMFATGHDSAAMEDSTRGGGGAAAQKVHARDLISCIAYCWYAMLMVPLPMQLENLPTMVQGVWSDDPKAQLENTTHFRKLLSIGAMPSTPPPNHAGLISSCMIDDATEPAQSATRRLRRSSARASYLALCSFFSDRTCRSYRYAQRACCKRLVPRSQHIWPVCARRVILADL